jgi:hypothetical protein
MTVSSTTTKNSYSGNASTTTFAYGFKIFANTDLTVILRSALGAETVQTLTTHYTVSNVGVDGGGNVVFVAAPASGVTVLIRRNMALTQSTDYVANDPFPAATHEDALDRLTFISQQIQEEVNRSIKLSRTNTMTSTEFTTSAADRANKILAFDTSGELAVTQELGTYKGTDTTTTTAAYTVRDIIKSTTAGQLNNVYICIANSVIGDTLTDTDHFELLVDAYSAASSATAAAASADAAQSSEDDAAADLVLTNADVVLTNADVVSTNADVVLTNADVVSTNADVISSAASAAAAAATFDLFDDSYLGAKATNPTLDNDGNALTDGALYFDTTNDVMKVYDLATTTWLQLTPTVENQNNINTVAGISADVTTVAGISSDVQAVENISANITTVAGIDSDVTSVAGVSANVSTLAPISANITTVAGISANVTTVAGISANVTAVANDSTDIGTVATDLTGSNNIGTVAGSISNVNLTGGSITNVNTVATNIGSVNNFAEVYRIDSSAPTTSLDVGDLYFDTTSDILKVYGASGWQSAGSSVNGTSQRYHYDIGGAVTSVTGSDANGNTLAYDAGYVDVYVNGVRMSTADVTVTSGDTVTFTEALASGDEVDIVAYGTFSVASLNADNLDSGTVPIARLAGSYTGITGTGALNAGSITSGFGAIDNGASAITTTGAISGGTLGLTGVLTANGGAVFNEGGADVDFRVESDDNANMLVVNAGDDIVGIGTATQGRETNLAVVGTDQLPTGAWSQFGIYSNDSYAINKGGSMMFGGQDGSVVRSFFASIKGAKENSTSGNYAGYLAFYTRPSDDTPREYMRITSAGRLLIGLSTGNGDDEALQVYRNGAPTLSVARQQDGTIVNFRVGSVDGAAHGSISISGVTCSYNAFSGSHWSRLSDNSKPTILKGTIIETIDEMCDWYRAEFTVEATTKEDTDSESETFGQQIEDVAEHIASKPIELPSGGAVGDTISVTSNGITYDNAVIAKEGDEKHVKCKISDTADSKKVYGVYAAWDNDDDTVNDMYVTAVGTHVVRINGSVTVSAGDLLASNGDGTAKVQDDDIIRSKTIGKVLTNIKQETYSDGSYTVPCALYCG